MKKLPNYNRTISFCYLCRTLHGVNVDDIYNTNYKNMRSYIPLFGPPKKARIVSSLSEWWYNTENTRCFEKNNSGIPGSIIKSFTELKINYEEKNGTNEKKKMFEPEMLEG